MVQKYGHNIWYSSKEITNKELANLELIEILAINKIITERQMIYKQIKLSSFFPQVLTLLPLSLN